MNIGDRVRGKADFILACGSGRYDYAICVSISPLVLVSPQGDMRWSSTVMPVDVVAGERGGVTEIETAMQRWVRDRLEQNPKLNPEEEQFHLRLDIDPEDHTTRLALADWLMEHDDPRGPGYMALGLWKLVPSPFRFPSWGYDWNTDKVWWECVRTGKCSKFPKYKQKPDVLPEKWSVYFDCDTRREAEDEAARRFAKMTPEQQAKYLNPVLI